MPTGHLSSPNRTRSRKIKTNEANKTVYDRRHRCDFAGCQKAFTRLEHLRRHQLNHEAVQTWACNLCPATFVRKDLWKRHMSVTHDAFSNTSPSQPCGSSCSSFAQCHCNPPWERNNDDGSTSDPESLTRLGIVGGVGGPVCSSSSPTPRQHQRLRSSRATFHHPTSSVGDLRDQGETGEISASQNYDRADMFPGLLDWSNEAASSTAQHGLEKHAFDFDNLITTNESSLLTLDNLNETGIDWFLHNQCLFDLTPTSHPAGQDVAPLFTHLPPLADAHTKPMVGGDSPASEARSIHHRPIFLQEAQSKPFIVETGKFEPPDCGFRICNALTEGKRAELLAELSCYLNNDINIDEQIFSFDSMKHGIHFYFRHIDIQYTFLHHEFLIPSSEDSRQARLTVCGPDSEPGAPLFWAIISTGWSLMRSRGDREYVVAARIQRALRISVMSHPGLACSPPLWLVQTLFTILLFARYRGNREDYGFASIFHGVLLEATRRLDNTSHSTVEDRALPLTGSSGLQAWIKWISMESIQRIVRHTFILDVEHAVLHGGEPSMLPFDLNIRLSTSVDAWYATSPQAWEQDLLHPHDMWKSVSFVEILKMLWNPRTATTPAESLESLPRGSDIALYGLISIAIELRRRKELKFLDQSSGTGTHASLSSLGNTVIHSLRNWEPLWAKMAVPDGLIASYLWRNCSCMIHLAYTLYEVGPIDLQTLAGRAFIEGKRRSATDYANSRRKIGRWVKEDRAWLGLARAATLIQDRIYNTTPDAIHCHHCLWCLYLATLICWNFGFALTGKSSPEHLVKNNKVTAPEEAEAECLRYLKVATSLPARFQKEPWLQDILGMTTGLIVVLIRFFRSQCPAGTTMESIEVLVKLVRLYD